MDAAVSLHHHGALPLHASLPPPSHHHRALPLPLPLNQRRPPISSSSYKPPAARLTLASRPTSPARSAPAALPAAAAAASAHYSSRAATGYAAALADACARAGTLLRASRHARSLLDLSRRQSSSSSQEKNLGQLDARVAALVRMLVAKGKVGMVAEVMAEFAAICDQLLPLASRSAHGY